jgi:hypothetical protein
VHRADNLSTFMCQLSTNSGGPKLLEPYEPVLDHNGINFTSLKSIVGSRHLIPGSFLRATMVANSSPVNPNIGGDRHIVRLSLLLSLP